MGRSLSLRIKLLGLFIVVGGAVAAATFFGIRNASDMTDRFRRLVVEDTPRIEALLEIKAAAAEIKAQTTAFRLMGEGAVQAEGSLAAEEKYALLAAMERIRGWEDRYRRLSTVPDANRQRFLIEVSLLQDRILSLSLDLLALKEQGADGAATAPKAAELKDLTLELGLAVDAALDKEFAQIDRLRDSTVILAYRSNQMNAVIAAIAILFGIVSGFFVARLIIGSIRELREAAMKIASGDLNQLVPVRSSDEVGDLAAAFNEMASNLRRSHADLVEAKAHDEAILQSIGDAVFAVNLEGRVSMMNVVAERLTGVEARSALGRKYSEVFRFVHEKDRSKPYPPFVEDAMKIGKATEMTNHTLLIRRDGTEIPVADSAAPVRDAKGQISGCVVVFRDVSRERSLDRAKDEFISIATHQLKTPLGGMRWGLDLLRGGDAGKLSKMAKETLDDMNSTAQHMIELINELLDVSRIDQGRVINEPKPVDVRAVVFEAVRETTGAATERGVKVGVQLPEGLPPLVVDPKRFREVVQNLISNAIKYNRPNGRVDVKASSDGKKLTFSVSDTGIGVPEEDKARLFAKFYRASNAKKEEGTGLGLYVVKSFVESWGGTVTVDSEMGKGTTFTLVIPLAPAPLTVQG